MTRPDPVSLRLPEPLKSSIQQAANQAGRSLNAEIRMRLEWSFDAGFDGQSAPAIDRASELAALKERFSRLEALVAKLDPDGGASLVPDFTREG